MVLTHPPLSHAGTIPEDAERQELLEKPSSRKDNLRMLLDLNGGVCEVVTGVTLGASYGTCQCICGLSPPGSVYLVYPVLQAPGYDIKLVDPIPRH